MNEAIDVESEVVLNLVSQYQAINADLNTMAAGCKKPDIPKFLDIGSNINGLMGIVQKSENELNAKMNEVTEVLNKTIDILKANDVVNMVDFFNESDLTYVLSGAKSIDGETVALSLEERCQRMDELADNLYSQLKELKETYQKLYGDGISYDAKSGYRMIKLFDSLGIFSFRGNSNQNYIGFPEEIIYHKAELFSNNYNAHAIIDLSDYLEENGIIDALKSYINGNSWNSSGMEALFGNHLREIDKEEGNLSGLIKNPTDAEMIFTYRYLSGESNPDLTKKFFSYIISPEIYDDMFNNGILDGARKTTGNQRFSSEYRTYFSIKNEEAAKEYLKDFLRDSNIFQTYEDLVVDANVCSTLESDIAIYNQMAYDYRFNGRAYAYEFDKSNSKYNEYFYRDYTKYSKNDMLNDYEYMSQGEIALYTMYKELNDIDKANDYLKSLSDRITSRKAMGEVENRLDRWNKDGSDILDYFDNGFLATIDGINSYIDGIGALFGNGRRSENDYVMMYMLSMLSEENSHNFNFSTAFRDAMKNNYEVMSAVGSSAIPVALSFIPGGRVVGGVASTLSAAGNKYKYARQNGSDGTEDIRYSILSGLSDAALMYFVSGLTGVNGTDNATKSLSGWVVGNIRSFGSAYVGTFLDAQLKSWTLGETIDWNSISDSALHSAWIAAQSTGVTNATVAGVKLGSKLLKKIGQKLDSLLCPSALAAKNVITVNLTNPTSNTDNEVLNHLEGKVDRNGNPQGGHIIPSNVKLEVNKKSTWRTSNGDIVEYTPITINGSGSEGYFRIKSKGSTNWTPQKYSSFFPQTFSMKDIENAINQTISVGTFINSDQNSNREIVGSVYKHTWVRIICDKTTGNLISVHTTFNRYAPKYAK